MGDFPDPEEEYELMYADELELLRNEEDLDAPNIVQKKPLPAKRSLNFSSPGPKKSLDTGSVAEPIVVKENGVENDIEILTPSLQPLDELLTPNLACSLQPPEDLLTPNVASKRTAEDLFGDIDDLDLEDQLPNTKRQKTEEEVDLELIEKIKEGRRMRQLLLEPSAAVQADRAIYNAKENMSLNVPRWSFLPLTNSDGDRVYVKLESAETWEASLTEPMKQTTGTNTFTAIWEEAQKILEAKQQRLIESSAREESFPNEADVILNEDNTKLWVDKYRPQSYLDLLSEEPVNRALLHWLHLWDKIVFKKEFKTQEPQQRNHFSARSGQFQLTNKWRGKKDAAPELDEDGRPHHKVALLCGPPGVGKTTLAHLLARLAGYRPVELNASDERSTDAFQTALQSATLMRSLLDAEKRPNCLILDEIDGAPLPTVELLVKWCTATSAEGKKKGKKSQPLKRPVIAICNDLYASSLRPLRPVALVIQVTGVSVARLATRLQQVAALEHVSAPPHALHALATRAHSDVRAALQVLSFLRVKGKQLTLADVNNTAIGTKDCSQSVMQALQAVFTTHDDSGHILKVVQASGEYDRLIDGIFENYLTARVDARLQIACETLSWLRLYDSIHSWTMRTQNYSLYGMLPLCIARCHTVLASRTPQRVKFPIQALEMSRKKTDLESVISSVYTGCTPKVIVGRNTLVLDVIPMLPHLLSPNLRSNNVQLCSESERNALRTVAGAMCDYGLQYIQQRTQEGLYTFVIQPDIYKVALFSNDDRGRPTPAIRQAIAREQQMELIRRNDEMANRVPTTQSQSKPKDLKPKVVLKETKEVLPNHLQRLEPKEIKKTTTQVHKDFFGRIVPLSQVPRNDAVPDVISSSSVFYQYQEGFNNAVRRNVKTKDLL